MRPNVIWAMDFQFDQTSDLRTFKMLNIIDEFTRECLAIDVGRSIRADDVVNRLDQLVKERGSPGDVRMDLHTEFVAHTLNDWCRFNATGSLFIDPGSPWQNGWIELFNAAPRRVPQWPAVRYSLRDQGAPPGLATRIQSPTNPQRPSSANVGQVRRDLEAQEPATTRRVSGLGIGVRPDR